MKRGVDRVELEGLLRSLIIRVSGIPSDRVFFSDYASDVTAPAPNESFISMTIGPPTDSIATATRTVLPSLEYYRLTVTGGGPATLSLNVRGTTYTVSTANQASAAWLRSELFDLMRESTEFHATETGAASIDIESRMVGVALQAAVTSGPAAIVLYRGDAMSLSYRDVNLQLQLRCWGSYADRENGVVIAEQLACAMMHPEESAELREAGYAITFARCSDQRFVDGSEMRMIGEVDAEIRCVIAHAVPVSRARTATFSLEERS